VITTTFADTDSLIEQAGQGAGLVLPG
jgi:hypothetical protein